MILVELAINNPFCNLSSCEQWLIELNLANGFTE